MRLLASISLALLSAAILFHSEAVFADSSYSSYISKGSIADENKQTPLQRLLSKRKAVVRIFVASEKGIGAGTGFIISKEGLIATNKHVTKGANGILVYILSEDASFATMYKASIVQEQQFMDLVLLQLNGELKNLPEPLKLSYKQAELLDEVIAIGFPSILDIDIPEAANIVNNIVTAPSFLENLEPNITKGDISKLGTWLVHGAKIAPGNSGGPLISLKTGEVVGINTATRQSRSVFFLAIPVNQLNRLVNIHAFNKSHVNDLELNIIDNDAESMWTLAYKIIDDDTAGEYTITDAIDLLKKSAKLGFKESYITLGDLYRDDKRVKTNTSLALKYYLEGNTPHCWIRIAEIYENGEGSIDKNEAKAYDYAKRASLAGQTLGTYKYSIYTNNGVGVKANLHEAIRIIEEQLAKDKSAKKDSASNILLALATFISKRGEEDDIKRAIKLATVVATEKYGLFRGPACSLLSKLYSDKRYKNVDFDKVLYYLRLGADVKDVECLLNLGRVYIFGIGVKKDIRKGLSYLDVVVDNEQNPEAYGLAYVAFQRMESHDIAVGYCLKAARLDFVPAQIDMAIYYLEGKHIARSATKAKYWLRKAASSNGYPKLVAKAKKMLKSLNVKNSYRAKNTRKKHKESLPKRAAKPW